MESLDTIFELCKEAGVHEQAVIPVEKIKFSDEVRHLCEVNYCGSYGKTWACPPGVGSVEECREKCMAFTQVYIFTTWHPLEDSLDLDGMQEGKAAHEEVCARVRKIFEENFAETLVLTSEGCGNCLPAGFRIVCALRWKAMGFLSMKRRRRRGSITLTGPIR